MAENILQAKSGDRISVQFENREFDVIVIDPNGLGQGQPSVGFGFRMADKYMGVPYNTLSDWQAFEGGRNNRVCGLKAPSGKAFRVVEIMGSDGNTYKVIEAADWMAFAGDVAKHPGKLRKGTKDKLIDFLIWFAVKGFYAEAYAALKGSYTAKDSRATSAWLNARSSGVPVRKAYTDLLQAEGVTGFEFAQWTDSIYQGLFGMTAKQMKAQWDLVDGSAKIARNYISEAEGLEAVRFCETITTQIFAGNLKEAHRDAIALTARKFKLR